MASENDWSGTGGKYDVAGGIDCDGDGGTGAVGLIVDSGPTVTGSRT